jgi:hypothetical protein
MRALLNAQTDAGKPDAPPFLTAPSHSGGVLGQPGRGENRRPYDAVVGGEADFDDGVSSTVSRRD